MDKKTTNIIKICFIALGTFSVAVLANSAADKLDSEENKTKRKGLVYSGVGVIISLSVLYLINNTKKINNSPI